MRRFRTFLDFGKEEEWLNRMAADGWLLSGKGFAYRFRPVEPGPGVIRIDFRDRAMSAADFDDYRTLFADAGWQHVDGSRHGGTQYFASFTGEADADIFSDVDSRAARYKRSIAYRSALVLPLFTVLIALSMQGMLMLSPADWYLTPGLWQMEGAEFVWHFLFETPFVLMRNVLPLLLLVMCVAVAVQVLLQYRLYREAVRTGI